MSMVSRLQSRRCKCVTAAVSLSGLCGPAFAEVFRSEVTAPFSIRNLSPPAAIFGLSTWEGRGSGQSNEFSTVAGIASHYVLDGNGAEELLLDGETWRFNVRYRRHLGDKWSASVAVPLYRHSGGFLDDAVDAWHGFFNLPDGKRNLRGEDELRYVYVAAKEQEYLLDATSSGYGDVQISVSRHFGTDRSFTLKTSLKLPTGDANILTGSGGTDLSVSLLKERRRELSGAPAGVYWGVGVLSLGESETFAGRNRDWAAFGILGCGWQPRPRLGFKVQLDAHTSLYESSLGKLGGSSIQASLGGWWQWEPGRILEVAVSEDIVVKASPDIAIQVGLSWFL